MIVAYDGVNKFVIPKEILCVDLEQPFYMSVSAFDSPARVVTLSVEDVGQFLKFSFEKDTTDDLANGVVSLVKLAQYAALIYQDPANVLLRSILKVYGLPDAPPI